MRATAFAGEDIGAGAMDSDHAEARGRLVQEARTARGMSRDDGAKAAGISASRWRQIETGRQPVRGGGTQPTSASPWMLAKVAEAVGLDPRELLDAAGIAEYESGELTPPPGPRSVPDESRKARASAVVDVSDLPERDRDRVAAFVMGLRAARGDALG